ncbi:MAG: ABC transporter ATP-binding protein [Anaerolineaceae bacterium]|nr:ABC transporter ATP-binding protein [Anaerolineaceae bacterium]
MPDNNKNQQSRTSTNRPSNGGIRRGRGRFSHTFEKPKDRKATLLRLWPYLRRRWLALLLVFVVVLVSTGLNILTPYLMGVIIDEGITAQDPQRLLQLVIRLAIVYTLISVTTFIQIRLMVTIAQRTVFDLRNDLFNKLQTLSLRFFDQNPHGELMSRLTNDVENISMVLSESLTELFSNAVSLIGLVIIMFIINPYLAMVNMLIVPAMAFLTRWISKRTRKGYREQQDALGELNGIIEETLTGQKVVIAYSRDKETIDQFEVANQRLRAASTFAQTYSGVLGPINNMMNNLGYALGAAIGAWLVLINLSTIGVVASFINYARQLSRPLNSIANLFNTIQSAIAGAERVFEIMDEEPDLKDKPGAPALNHVEGDVRFEHVNFAYTKDVPVLKDICLHAPVGKTFALVGPTGAGKTTIINLLSRFYDIDTGGILIDQNDIRDVQKSSIRRSLGVVLQDTFLFSDTVMNNIRYGRLDATDEEVIEAARLANADHFIHALPAGYQTQLSERGSNLSQGQRQLLSIARAMLADPDILILDEATSSVDTRTEVHIQEALLKLMEGRTSFVIAHRLSTIRNADQILVINNGEIVERGNHQELLEMQQFYYNLYMSQFKGRVAAVI